MNEKERFIEELKKTGRAGVDRVIAGLEELGFFAADGLASRILETK